MSDSDSDGLNLFTGQTQRVTRARSPIRLPSSSPEVQVISDNSTDDDEAIYKRPRILSKKKTKRNATKPLLVGHVPGMGPSQDKRGGGVKSGAEGGIRKSLGLEVGTIEGHLEPVKVPLVESVEERKERLKRERIEARKKELRKKMEAALDVGDSVSRAARLTYPTTETLAPVTSTDAPNIDTESEHIPPTASVTPLHPTSSVSTTATKRDESVRLVIRMVLDPERRQDPRTSERAIAMYEKARQFIVNRRDPFSRVLKDLANRLSLPEGSLVLEFQDDRIFFPNTQSPFDFRIQANQEVEMRAYERHVYDKMKGGGFEAGELTSRDRRGKSTTGDREDEEQGNVDGNLQMKSRARSGGVITASSAGHADRALDTSKDPNSDVPSSRTYPPSTLRAPGSEGPLARSRLAQSRGAPGPIPTDTSFEPEPVPGPVPGPVPEPEPEPEETKIMICMRGPKGEFKMLVRLNVTVKMMLKVFVKKMGMEKGSEGRLKCVFDGERLEGDASVEQVGLEDQDMVEVEEVEVAF